MLSNSEGIGYPKIVFRVPKIILRNGGFKGKLNKAFLHNIRFSIFDDFSKFESTVVHSTFGKSSNIAKIW